MKLSTIIATTGALVISVNAQEVQLERRPTTKPETTFSSTYSYGKDKKTKVTSSSTSNAYSYDGGYKTKVPYSTTSSSQTYSYEKKPKTSKSSSTTSTGTHTYGKINKPSKPSAPTASGTHSSDGKFKKPKRSICSNSVIPIIDAGRSPNAAPAINALNALGGGVAVAGLFMLL